MLRSLGLRTDLIFHRFEGEVTDRGRYLVVRTPSNPTYRWGNLLIFDAPPGPGDFGRWTELFEAEIGRPPEVTHKVFGWDTVAGWGEVAPFLEAGYKLETSVVMAADALERPAKYNGGLTIRPLETDADFSEHTELHVLCRDPAEDEAGNRVFYGKKTASYREMIRAGLGRWFGAFLDGRLVGDLGIFTGGGVGRYQSVVTHPDYRRRGVCTTLLYEVGRYGFERMGARTLVIVADEHYFAKNIYASVGFVPRERQAGLEWVLRDD